MTLITKITARMILDSRGNPTVEAQVHTKNNTARASVPSGASTGIHEAVELRDGTRKFHGKGVQKEIRNIKNKIAPALKGIDVFDQEKIDFIMADLDGTENKSKLGATAILAVSLACARVAAKEKKIELFEYLRQLSQVDRKMKLPLPLMNVINGGKHAGNKLVFQECMIIPKSTKFHQSLRMGSEIYHTLKSIILKKYGPNAINVGDEGGFAPPLKKLEEGLDLLKLAIRKAEYNGKVDMAIDCAASEFYKKKFYFIPRKVTSEKLQEYYLTLIKKYPIKFIEDPLEQDDFVGFAQFTSKVKINVVGDDLTVTNVERVEEAIHEKSANTLLLKVNQIGTLSEALAAVRLAYKHNWNVIVSHRSGDTEDTFIADLAVGIGCGYIKTGAPCRGERTAKYNRLLRIEEILKNKA